MLVMQISGELAREYDAVLHEDDHKIENNPTDCHYQSALVVRHDNHSREIDD